MKKTDVAQLLFELQSCICEMVQMSGSLNKRVAHSYIYLFKYLFIEEPLDDMPKFIEDDFVNLRKLLVEESMSAIQNKDIQMQELGFKKSNWTIETAIRNFSGQKSKQIIKSITILYLHLFEWYENS